MNRVAITESARPIHTNTPRQRDSSPYVLERRRSTGTTPSPHSSQSIRHSPYPERRRTPPRAFTTPTAIQPRSSATVTPAASSPNSPGRLQVRVLVKEAINKHDKSGKLLAPVVGTGNSFPDLMRQLWEKYRHRVTTVAVEKDEGGWESVVPTLDEWWKVMQFRYKRHPIDHDRSVEWWNNWVVSAQGETVHLLVYPYGTAIVSNKQLGEFKSACIRPLEVDRAGATAESGVRDVVQKLQCHCGRTFRAEAMVWRMWALQITSNRDRSTWDTLVEQPAPAVIASNLHPANSEMQNHLSNMNKSAKLALECVDSFLLQFDQLQRDYDALGHRFALIKASLKARKTTIEGFLNDVLPVPADEVADPLETMENVDDQEHMV